MRKILLAALTAALAASLLAMPSASAAGPSGSTESGNRVSCGNGFDAVVAKVYVSAIDPTSSNDPLRGAEVCSDDTVHKSSPWHGRVIVSGGTTGYVAIDGDETNSAHAALQGFVRVGTTGSCQSGKDKQDSTTDCR